MAANCSDLFFDGLQLTEASLRSQLLHCACRLRNRPIILTAPSGISLRLASDDTCWTRVYGVKCIYLDLRNNSTKHVQEFENSLYKIASPYI